MLCRKTVSVYCESHTEHTNPVRTSQETHYVSSTETNRLMLFRKTIAVYCENHTEHTNPVRTSQERHYVSATETNRLMLFRKTIAVYCENHTEHTNPVCTSQERHYVSITEPSRLMLLGEVITVCCESHTTQCVTDNLVHWEVKESLTYRINVLFPSLCSKCKSCNKPETFSPNVGERLPDYTVSHPKRLSLHFTGVKTFYPTRQCLIRKMQDQWSIVQADGLHDSVVTLLEGRLLQTDIASVIGL
jgi:translation initiation factor IF-1